MMKTLRKMIFIDEDKCDGCGQCITGCVEGALALIDGKAKLVKESYCDGLGACLGECPTGALTIEEREVAPFDEEAALAHVAAVDQAAQVAKPAAKSACPGSTARQFEAPAAAPSSASAPSQLTHWPIQLHLINPAAPQFQNADVLVAADCTAFALGGFHGELLAGRSLVIACPKLDDLKGYMEKLTALFADAQPTSVTVPRMQVPCCSGLIHMVLEARKAAGSTLPVREIVVGVEGNIVSEQTH